MLGYLIETSCAHTGQYQHTEAVDTKADLIAFCTAEWRRESVHVVYTLHTYTPRRMIAVFVAGRCVSPFLNDLRK